MAGSPELWRGTRRVEHFCRHLLALCITYEHRDGNQHEQELRFAAYAGTLIKIHNVYCFLTAGHILREVREAQNSPRIEMKSAVLADTFGRGPFNDHPIPFDLKNTQFWFVDEDEEGLDFGVMWFNAHYVRLLAANGTVGIEESHWINQSKVQFDGYAMLGLPEQFTSDFVSASGKGAVSPTMFAIQRLPGPPPGTPATIYERFVGSYDPALPLRSLKGMSGGPIFGFNLQDRFPRYWIVALQSSWNEKRNLVFGCPLATLASLMTEWARDVA